MASGAAGGCHGFGNIDSHTAHGAGLRREEVAVSGDELLAQGGDAEREEREERGDGSHCSLVLRVVL